LPAIDPYDVCSLQGAKATALIAGRSVCRFYFHLAQYVVACGTCDDVPLTSAFRSIESINSRVRCGEPNSISALSHVLNDCAETITSVWFRNACAEELTLLEAEYQSRPEEAIPLHEVVDQFVRPWQMKISEAISSVLEADVVAWFKLGKTLEEGLCRPDIFRFQIPFTQAWPILVLDAASATYLELLEQESDLRNSCCKRGLSPKAIETRPDYTIRQPGDIAPSRLWNIDLLNRWRDVALGDNELNAVFQFLSAKNKDKCPNELRRHIDRLFESTYAAAAGTQRLVLDLGRNRVILDGVPYVDQDPRLVILLDGLNRGDTSFSAIKAGNLHAFGRHDKLCHVLQKAPSAIRAIVSHGTGRPTLLNLS
jgi:hypothetical protein